MNRAFSCIVFNAGLVSYIKSAAFNHVIACCTNFIQVHTFVEHTYIYICTVG